MSKRSLLVLFGGAALFLGGSQILSADIYCHKNSDGTWTRVDTGGSRVVVKTISAPDFECDRIID
jgi:hypothetical protein